MESLDNPDTIADLVIGWTVTPRMDPTYWVSNDNPLPGAQSESDLVRIHAGTLSTHSLICAQSGSGKSSLLGRILEEVLLSTKARCLIIDPNADFRRVASVEREELWTAARYDVLSGKGRLPHEASRDVFALRWSDLSVRVRTGPEVSDPGYSRLLLKWERVPIEFITEGTESLLRGRLHQWHVFVEAIGQLALNRSQVTKQAILPVDEAERIAESARCGADRSMRAILREEYDVRRIARDIAKSATGTSHARRTQLAGLEGQLIANMNKAIDVAAGALNYADPWHAPEAQAFYFGKARQYQSTGIAYTSIDSTYLAQPLQFRIDVLDLPSFSELGTRLLAVNSVLSEEWRVAHNSWSTALTCSPKDDQRVPTFIVVDEAHNLIPAEVNSGLAAVVRDQFRTIVAEGRKYGLFLILVTQRPEKLDRMVISECDNTILMRIGSRSQIGAIKNLLGLDDVPHSLLEQCVGMHQSRGLLCGGWATRGPTLFYSAARRTVEGGRNLRKEWWASPYTDRSHPAHTRTGPKALHNLKQKRRRRRGDG